EGVDGTSNRRPIETPGCEATFHPARVPSSLAELGARSLGAGRGGPTDGTGRRMIQHDRARTRGESEELARRTTPADRNDRKNMTSALRAREGERIRGRGDSWGTSVRTVRGVLARQGLRGPGPTVLEGGETRSQLGRGPGTAIPFPPPLFQGKESEV